jgi:hypothetical protein
MIGVWRKMHNEELHASQSSTSKIRMIKSRKTRWAGHIARMGAKMNAYRIFVGKPVGKRSVGRPRCRRENNLKMCLKVVWTVLAQERDQWKGLVNMVMILRVPLNVGKLLSNCKTDSFSRRVQLHGVSI